MFEFSEGELEDLWTSVDLNGDGLVSRPKAALLLKRAVTLQHSKMESMMHEKREKGEDIEAGLIRGIPRWMQWYVEHAERADICMRSQPVVQHVLQWASSPCIADRTVCCYTGAGAAQTVNHNLGVVPEMMWIKNRGSAENWAVYHSALGTSKYLHLNTTDPALVAYP